MDKETPQEKLPYAPPELKRIELRTEEVLGVGCKSAGNVGPSATSACALTNCSNVAS